MEHHHRPAWHCRVEPTDPAPTSAFTALAAGLARVVLASTAHQRRPQSYTRSRLDICGDIRLSVEREPASPQYQDYPPHAG